MDIYTGNYTGPYWSDGKLQTSVEFGTAEPQSQLDALSRLHDTAYAHYSDREHREAADMWYNTEAKKLAGQFPELAGSVVLYGNYTSRQASQLASDIGKFSFLPGLGAIYGAAKFVGTNLVNSQKMINGTYLKKEKQDVLKLFETDPALQRKPISQRPAFVPKAAATNRPGQEVVPAGEVSSKAQHKQSTKTPSSNVVVPVMNPGPSASVIRNAEIVQRQRDRAQHYVDLHTKAMESNMNMNANHISRYVRPGNGRLARAVMGKKKKRNKVTPQ